MPAQQRIAGTKDRGVDAQRALGSTADEQHRQVGPQLELLSPGAARLSTIKIGDGPAQRQSVYVACGSGVSGNDV